MAFDVLILTRADVARVLDLDACIAAVADAFAARARGTAPEPGVMSLPAADGGFHVKGALLGRYCAVKTNGNYPANPERNGLPTVQGTIALADTTDGRPLAILDSIEITTQRTAAATAVAARHLARPDAATVAVCGCGVQGRIQLRALQRVRPIRRVLAWDPDAGRRDAYAREVAAWGLDVAPADTPGLAARASDIVVTCTPARRWFLGRDDIRPGTFVAAVGADAHGKQELQPELLAAATVVADVLDQAATIGDLQHALAAGLMTRQDVHAELGQVVIGAKPGRRSAEEITVFDSTGTALQDVAAAALVYEAALAGGVGVRVALGA